MAGFKVTVYGVNTVYDTATVSKATLDDVSGHEDVLFEVLGLYKTVVYDITSVRALSGKNNIVEKIATERYNLKLKPINFINQTDSATYNSNRFFETLLNNFKTHFLFFSNTDEIFDYPYLSDFLNSTTVLTHALQVNFLGNFNINQDGNLYFFEIDFEATYDI